jgi:uncharacterized protein YwgA
MIRFATPSAIAPDEAILSLLEATPDHQVQGKKRIQKLLYLCRHSSAPISASFKIRHYGVFSEEVADALDCLCAFGDLETQDVQVAPNGYFSTVFSKTEDSPKVSPHPVIQSAARVLASYATSTLEVASTIAYYLDHGHTEDQAILGTQAIKPALTTPKQIETSKILLDQLSKLGVSQNGQRSAHP